MTEIVFGTTNLEEFEVLECSGYGDEIKKYRTKKISTNELIEVLTSLDKSKEKEIFNFNIFNVSSDELISHKKTNKKDTMVFNFKEQMIRTFFNNEYYKIIHCNAFIRITVENNKVESMEVYPYDEYKGADTKLFDNPYPNRYSMNKTCLGTADRSVRDSYIKTILGLLETAYTSVNMNFNDKSLENTKVAFEYLTKNPFPYDKLKRTKKTLKDII